jgi:hypothetical protein
VLSVWLVVLSGVVLGGALIGALVVERHEQQEQDQAYALSVP